MADSGQLNLDQGGVGRVEERDVNYKGRSEMRIIEVLEMDESLSREPKKQEKERDSQGGAAGTGKEQQEDTASASAKRDK